MTKIKIDVDTMFLVAGGIYDVNIEKLKTLTKKFKFCFFFIGFYILIILKYMM